jgi:drug/metabolite transporter (DMT)-like permease
MATTSLFAALLEPFFLKSNFKWLDLGLSILIIPAMALVAQTVEEGMQLGILVGLASAFLAALFSVLNKKYVSKADPYTITYVELTSAWLFISALLLLFDFGRETIVVVPPSQMDWIWMIVLALACTTLTFILSLRALTGLSAFASTLVVNLEPVYGIILAVLLLGEHQEMSPTFYVGCAIILMVVLSYPFLKPRRS